MDPFFLWGYWLYGAGSSPQEFSETMLFASLGMEKCVVTRLVTYLIEHHKGQLLFLFSSGIWTSRPFHQWQVLVDCVQLVCLGVDHDFRETLKHFPSFCFGIFVEGHISFQELLSSFIFWDILKMSFRSSVLFSSPNILSFADFFPKYIVDFASLFAARYFSLLFRVFFHSFQSLCFSLITFATVYSHHQVSLHQDVSFVQPQVLSQPLRRQDFISFYQSFTFSPLKLGKASWTHWLYATARSGRFSFHVYLVGMWLLVRL